MKHYIAKKPVMVAGISYTAGKKIHRGKFDPARIPKLIERGIIEDPDGEKTDEINMIQILILSEDCENIEKSVSCEMVSTIILLLQYESAECIEKINEVEDSETLDLLSLVEHREDVLDAIDTRLTDLEKEDTDGDEAQDDDTGDTEDDDETEEEDSEEETESETKSRKSKK